METVFIVGRGRSGTELLRAILNSNKDVCAVPESLLAINLAMLYKNKCFSKEKTIQLYNKLIIDDRFRNWWEINNDELKKELISNSEKNYNSKSIYHLFCQWYSKMKKGYETPVIIDKHPLQSFFIEDLIKTFPQAKFIHIVRDFRDNVCSFKKVNFDLKSIESLSYRWVLYNEAIIEISEKYPNKFILIKYEKLVENPEIELSKLCQFLGIEYSNEMLNFHQKLELSYELKTHIDVKNPINNSKLNKYTHELNTEEIALSEAICCKTASKLGYKTEFTKPKPLSAYMKMMYSYVYTKAEILFFYIPIKIRISLINLYRKPLKMQ